MKLIAGLGNPGKKYERTRHNAGWRAVEAFFSAHEDAFGGWAERFDSRIAEGRIGGEKVVLLLPQTFMNLSGDAVGAAADFWKIAPEDIVIAHDDADLAAGKVRIRRDGASGGHNGIKSVIERLGTDAFPRIKIGIASELRGGRALDEFVIGVFTKEEEEIVGPAIERASKAIETVILEGIDAAANGFSS